MTYTFTEAKHEFDNKYGTATEYDCFLTEHLTFGRKTNFKKKNGQRNEQYYKWQFLYSIVQSGLFANGNLGQAIYVVPYDELIIVHCGNANGLFSPDDLWHAARCFKYRDFHQSIINKGVEETIELYKSDHSQSFDEQFIDAVAFGYQLAGKKEDARLLFDFNAKMFPHSAKAKQRLISKN